MGLFNRWSHGRFRDLLSPYIDRRLDGPQVAALEEHLATCDPCQEELQTLRATVNLLQALPHATPRRSFAFTERPQVSRVAPAYLWGMRAATAMTSIAVVLLVAGDLLGTFSRDIAPADEADPKIAETGATDADTPLLEAATESAPRTLASEADGAPETDYAASPDAHLLQTDSEVEETLPVTALEVALGSLLALLALVTLLATLQYRRRSHSA
ncbi:MAG: zf-HC2 domain-containing protein [Chloroflexota bacterium]